ncbi:MAG TPA: DegT/DnrJ/EryC1/StrS aminotransferase family protein [Polyangiaceae bacterium]|nr:DegT/DnrJ/EryC1/StrS aminotransferase family protein [Polyangiaceae bacterium]HNZ24077.1 DegT/DnrJ/EryC1/StrS aminotransferase family protein [Polyangiaceae bacterium]HOD21868.1 DegT/DnrJ/EryC1/StrS aminotransferase family protein [Polyangiaceae bacterium]HOE50962.1 DegT/DnrJ/EryC1/StrS aminotransferase family protein [Polyangiaceae bacterium]HOH01942.1 DegT/DnrJ/EryC1/StrS aminotransferase family protein [Polyangiaceae bacterium]
MNASPRKVEFFRHDLGEEEIASFRDTLSSLFLTTGPRVAEFETLLATYLGVAHCVGVTSCTHGLHLALLALGIGPGDEVITTPLTFVATANAIVYAGATPVFADVDPATGLLDPKAVEAAITSRTKAVIVVHLYGQMVDMKTFRALADRHHLALIEDSAHGVEMRRDGIAPGQQGDAAVFSFYATKTMTCGDGGAVAVRDTNLDRRLRQLRYHGISKDVMARHATPYAHWDMVELGYKAGLSDIDAALLIPQFGRLEQRRHKRELVVRGYRDRLEATPGLSFLRVEGISSHHLCTVLTPKERRDDLLRDLGQAGIGVAVNYRAIHGLTYYREQHGFRKGQFPHAEAIGDRTISLPLWPGLPEDDIDYVAERLRDLMRVGG